MTKAVAIVQSCYIPWKGYFDLIASVDEFVLFDDAQFTRRDWRNRNLIKTEHGTLWLTVPVAVKGRYDQLVRETVVTDARWADKHWRTIRASYARTPYFRDYHDRLETLFLGASGDHLSAINHHFLQGLCTLLGIRTPLSWSMDYTMTGDRT